MIIPADFIVFLFSVFFIIFLHFSVFLLYCEEKSPIFSYISTLGHSQVCFSNSTNNYCLIYIVGFVCLFGDSRRLCFSQNLQMYEFFYLFFLFIYLFICLFIYVFIYVFIYLFIYVFIYFCINFIENTSNCSIHLHPDIREFTKITVINNVFWGEIVLSQNKSWLIDPANIYLFQDNNRNTRKRLVICSKLTKNQNDTTDVVVMTLLLILNIFLTYFYGFYY